MSYKPDRLYSSGRSVKRRVVHNGSFVYSRLVVYKLDRPLLVAFILGEIQTVTTPENDTVEILIQGLMWP
jgi:hypothetical protein